MLTRRRFTQLTAALAVTSRLRAQSPAPLITAAEIAKIDHDRILLVDVFAKTTRQTPKHVIDACKSRLRIYDRGE